MHIFQWSNAVIVHPASPSRRRNDQYGAGEGAHSDHIGERQLSLVLRRISRAEPGIDPDRLERWATGKCLNICLPRSLRDESLAGSAEILPRDLRAGTTRSRSHRWHGCARRIGDIHQRLGAVDRAYGGAD